MPEQNPPYPPLELAHRVGSLADAPEPFAYYDQLGRETRDGILAALPSDWSFPGKRVLDFGCGAGRTLRHFTSEAAEAEIWGCDIDEESIGWMQAHMCPPFYAFVNGSEPPLDQPDASFDLIWAISVFTHLAANWSEWLVELHRLLKPDGLLLVTFMGRGMSQEIAGEPWDEDHFGMNVIKYGQSWDLGGPMVLHSPWWIKEHWGRAFEILDLAPDGFASKPWLDHGWTLMRKRASVIEAEELVKIPIGDEREARALAHNVKQLHAECLELRSGLAYFDRKLQEQSRQLATQATDLDRERAAAEGAHEEVQRVRREMDTLHKETTDLKRRLHAAQQQAVVAQEHSLNSANRLLDVEDLVAQSKARIFALEEALDALTPRLERADRVMAAMKASVSWRITAPLRALKRSR